jgi:hypothetical protein
MTCTKVFLLRTALALLLIPSFWTITAGTASAGGWVKVGKGHEMSGPLFGWPQSYKYPTLSRDTRTLSPTVCRGIIWRDFQRGGSRSVRSEFIVPGNRGLFVSAQPGRLLGLYVKGRFWCPTFRQGRPSSRRREIVDLDTRRTAISSFVLRYCSVVTSILPFPALLTISEGFISRLRGTLSQSHRCLIA